MNIIKKIIHGEEIQEIIQNVINDIYVNGPEKNSNLEILCYLALYRAEVLEKYKNQILNYMGIYYKNIETNSFSELIFEMYEEYIKDTYNESYTPVQASMYREIQNNQCFSFSAPTSTGKSFVFRNLILNSYNDSVIIVPSRALINEYYKRLCNSIPDKNVNILTFIDKINIKKAKRNIFIVTPERCKEIFKQKDNFNIDYFLFDEAQLSNEKSSRGMFFDSIVRRAQKAFPRAKFVFAHPFVINPDAQIIKNHFDKNHSKSLCYKQKNVGQIFYAHDKGAFYHFGIDKTIMGKNSVRCDFDPIEIAIKNNGSVLIYTTKSSIIYKKRDKKSIFTKFKKYIDICPLIEDEKAKVYINQIQKYIGATDEKNAERYSQMIYFMKRGVVIHHGSLPLHARLIMENFTNEGYCKICFATSTLEQGINMPFDVVYLNTFTASKPLSLKNLIGRAGRSTILSKFDFGSVIVSKNNMSSIRSIMNQSDVLDDLSMLESNVDDDLKDFQEAIIEGAFSDEYNMPKKQLTKLKDYKTKNIVKNILDTIFIGEKIISLTEINDDKNNQLNLYNYFIELYEHYLGRKLVQGEKNVFNTAIKILLWQIHCKSFKDICFYRYAYVSKKQERDKLKEEIKSNNNLVSKNKLKNLSAAFITEYADIPNKNLQVYGMFNNDTKAIDVDYDRIVFDTYDYLDKIIGFKLTDIFFAAFNEYFIATEDLRAQRMAKLVKYRTENEKEILLLRYGFSFEDIEWLNKYIEHISKEEIVFKETVNDLTADKRKIIDRFI